MTLLTQAEIVALLQELAKEVEDEADSLCFGADVDPESQAYAKQLHDLAGRACAAAYQLEATMTFPGQWSIKPMTLSPHAQAVTDAYGNFEEANADAMAAAIRALVEQTLPQHPEPKVDCWDDLSELAPWFRWAHDNRIREALLAIADELEAQS